MLVKGIWTNLGETDSIQCVWNSRIEFKEGTAKRMIEEIYLLPMTAQMHHEYFKEYQNDLDLYIDKVAYATYSYEEEKIIEKEPLVFDYNSVHYVIRN